VTDKLQSLRKSQQQEKRLAKTRAGTGAQQSLGSGNGWRRKNDVREDEYLWEMKRTDKRSISLKLDDLEGLRKNAWKDGRTPVFHVEIQDKRYIVLEEVDALALMDGE
jgi:hypothetical protein